MGKSGHPLLDKTDKIVQNMKNAVPGVIWIALGTIIPIWYAHWIVIGAGALHIVATVTKHLRKALEPEHKEPPYELQVNGGMTTGSTIGAEEAHHSVH